MFIILALSLYITLGGGILAAYNPRMISLEDCANGADFSWVTLCTAIGYALHGIGWCS